MAICTNCQGTGFVFGLPCKVCFPGDRMSLGEAFDCIQAEIKIENSESDIFPLTTDECHLFYSELLTHTFSRDHPMYHYASAILRRMRTFIERNEDKLNLCKDVKLDG